MTVLRRLISSIKQTRKVTNSYLLNAQHKPTYKSDNNVLARAFSEHRSSQKFRLGS